MKLNAAIGYSKRQSPPNFINLPLKPVNNDELLKYLYTILFFQSFYMLKKKLLKISIDEQRNDAINELIEVMKIIKVYILIKTKKE